MTSRQPWYRKSISRRSMFGKRSSISITRQLYLNEMKRISNHEPTTSQLSGEIGDIAPEPTSRIKQMALRNRVVSSYYNQASVFGNPRLLTTMYPEIPQRERDFIDAIERGDRHSVRAMLLSDNDDRINVNCKDFIGRTAIEIAVDNENIEIVQILVSQPDIHIGNALLHAVHENSYKLVEMLIGNKQITPEVLGCDWAQYRGEGDTFYNYPNYISPIVLAAQRNAFEILQLFLSKGAVINKPHLVTCLCPICIDERSIDSLRFSLQRINIYKALASPAWICLTSQDPILTGFKLSHRLETLAKVENEFRDAYVEMAHHCKTFVCDLLDECRSTEEVGAVLGLDASEQRATGSGLSEISLERLQLAVKYKQKQFVTHPHCQQVLANLWYGNIARWRQFGFWLKFLLATLIIASFPFAALLYLVIPKTRVGLMIRSPFMKFLFHSASFGFFLVLLVMAGSEYMYEEGREDTRGPAPSLFEWLLLLYVVGFIWNECKQIFMAGFKTYIKEWWNWLDFTMIALYLSSICLRSVSYFQLTSRPELYGPRYIKREFWPNNDPTLVSEALFAIANVFSFARIVFLFQANPHLGPLQISLGCMIIDISKFLLIFFLILTSFACGLNQLYWFYSFDDKTQQSNTAETARTYTSLVRSYLNLFWSLFGHTNTLSLGVPGGHAIVATVGEMLLLAYHAMAIIVLLNMLIAMMSNSFQTITANSDIEWKFSRTKLWMSYFDEGNTLPPPFNVIPSPKSVWYGVRSLLKMTMAKKGCILKDSEEGSNITSQGEPIKREIRLEILKRLVSRYMAVIKKRMRSKDVNADDMLEIKQDISSLRFELKEAARREMALHNRSIRGLKHELLSALQNDDTFHKNSSQEIDEDEIATTPPGRCRKLSSISSQFGEPDQTGSHLKLPSLLTVPKVSKFKKRSSLTELMKSTKKMGMAVGVSTESQDTNATTTTSLGSSFENNLPTKSVTRSDEVNLKSILQDVVRQELEQFMTKSDHHPHKATAPRRYVRKSVSFQTHPTIMTDSSESKYRPPEDEESSTLTSAIRGPLVRSRRINSRESLHQAPKKPLSSKSLSVTEYDTVYHV